MNENTKKEICRIFNNNGLRITIEANKQIINFLDVTFNLNRSTYQPFTKPNTSLQYVHQYSSPDEWATTKQACRDELVVYLFFSPIYSSLYFYVLSTVLRISSFTLYMYIYIYIYIYIHLTIRLRARVFYEQMEQPS